MNLPDFLCIGAQKAGTSWLNSVLEEHPQIFLPPIHELHFFDRAPGKPTRERQVSLAERALRRERDKGGAADQAYIDYLERLLGFTEVSLDWYKAAYSMPVVDGVLKGDVTPSYLELPATAVQQARDLLGPAKIILIMRRPAERLLSQLRMWAAKADRTDVPQTEDEWLKLFDRVARRAPRGSYSQGVEHWRSRFGAANMLTLPYGDMRRDARGFIDRVETHLGLERHDGYTLLDERIHVSMKMEMPQALKDAAALATTAEDDYIRNEFGDEFLERTT